MGKPDLGGGGSDPLPAAPCRPSAVYPQARHPARSGKGGGAVGGPGSGVEAGRGMEVRAGVTAVQRMRQGDELARYLSFC